MAGILLEQYAECLGAKIWGADTHGMSVQLVHRAEVRELLQDLTDASQPRFLELATGAAMGTTRKGRTVASGTSAPPRVGSELANALELLTHAQRASHVEAIVLRSVLELTGLPNKPLGPEIPLMDAGVDSLGATELALRLRTLSGLALSPLIVFEHPTPRAIAAHLLGKVKSLPSVACEPSIPPPSYTGAAGVRSHMQPESRVLQQQPSIAPRAHWGRVVPVCLPGYRHCWDGTAASDGVAVAAGGRISFALGLQAPSGGAAAARVQSSTRVAQSILQPPISKLMQSAPTLRQRRMPWLARVTGEVVAAPEIYTVCWVPTHFLGKVPEDRLAHTPVLVRCRFAHNATRSCPHSFGQNLEPQQLRSGCKLHRPFQAAVLMLHGEESIAPTLHMIQLTLALAQQLTALVGTPRLLLITFGVQAASVSAASAISSAAYGWAWGVARALRLEQPALHVSVAAGSTGVGAVGVGAVGVGSLLSGQQHLSASSELDISWGVDDRPSVAQLRRCSMRTSAAASHLAWGACAVTGQPYGLALRAAGMMVERGATLVLLVRSRLSAHSSRAVGAQWVQEPGALYAACVHMIASDISDLINGQLLMPTAGTPLSAVLHAASAQSDCLSHAIGASAVGRVFAPKALAATHLHHNAAGMPLQAMAFLSSANAIIAGVGHACDAATDAFLAALSLSRSLNGCTGSNMQLPDLWSGVSSFARQPLSTPGCEDKSACDPRLRNRGSQVFNESSSMNRRSQEHLSALLSSPRSTPLVAHALPTHTFLKSFASGAVGLHPSELLRRRPVPSASSSLMSVLAASLSLLPHEGRLTHLESAVLSTVHALTGGLERPAAHTPLMEASVDSLAATELVSRLRALTGKAVASTLVFDQPTPRAISLHLLHLMTEAKATAALAPAAAGRSDRALLSLVGAQGAWPSGCDNGVVRHSLQVACGDAIGGVPASRWTLDTAAGVGCVSKAQVDMQMECVRHGGFVEGAQLFDHRAFSVPTAEVEAMDPQQRLLLHMGYSSLHAAAGRRAMLLGSDGGVFLGIERPDWVLAQPASAANTVYAMLGDSVSAAAGRLPYTLGLHGPCMSVDTACSSALVAAHSSSSGVLCGECGYAVALAVSLKLMPQGTLGSAAAGMLSGDGRCKTFDSSANGYVRSESVGALVLRPDDGAGTEQCGSSVRQDGRSASLTAPNGSAQRTLLLTVLTRAAVTAADVTCVETHGTGTRLGDPTEVGSLAAVHGDANHPSPLVVGAAKASVGHSEAASGQVGLFKALWLLHATTEHGNARLRALNPLMGELASGALQFVVQRALSAEPQRSKGARLAAGVSSFGFGGTIVHVLLRTKVTGSPLCAATPRVHYKRVRFAWHIPTDAPARPRGRSASVAHDTPLMAAGLTSVGAVRLSSRLTGLTGLALPPTLVFDWPTPRAIAEHLTILGETTTADALVSVVEDELSNRRNSKWPLLQRPLPAQAPSAQEYTGHIFSPYVRDTLTNPEEYWYSVVTDLSAAQWLFKSHRSLRAAVRCDASGEWWWNGQREEVALPQFDAPLAPTDMRHLVYYCSSEKALHAHHLVFDGFSLRYLVEQTATRHIAESDIAVRADYLHLRSKEMLEHVFRAVSTPLFHDEVIEANRACTVDKQVCLDSPPSLNQLIDSLSKELSFPLAETFYAIVIVLTLQAAQRTSGTFQLIDNCRDSSNSNIFGMVLREYACVFEVNLADGFRANVRRAAGTMTALPQSYRRMFAEFAYGEYPELYVNNHDGMLINFLGHEVETAHPVSPPVGDHMPWVNQYEKMMEMAEAGDTFKFSSNLYCEFQGAELSVCGRATSVSWFASCVWPLLLHHAFVDFRL